MVSAAQLVIAIRCGTAQMIQMMQASAEPAKHEGSHPCRIR
jgi:hypothetical protein